MNCSRFFLVAFLIGLVSRVAAQDTLFDQPKHILLHTDKPDLVDEVDYRALVTQVEIRLRLAGFTVQSGSTAEFARDTKEWEEKIRQASKEDSKSVAALYSKAHPPSTTVDLGVSMTRFRNNEQSFIYHVEVAVTGLALIPTDNSPLQIEMKDREGKPLPLLAFGGRVHYAIVWLFKSTGQYGVNSWKGISDGSLSQVDEFINEYLKQNPKK